MPVEFVNVTDVRISNGDATKIAETSGTTITAVGTGTVTLTARHNASGLTDSQTWTITR